MRILSQDGMIDMPYEQMIVNIDYTNKNKIVACGVSCDGENSVFHIAGYSTEAKARKAMEMLHAKYSTLRMQEVIDRNVNQAVYERIKNEDKEKFFTALFQFPSDDELEV